MRVDKNRLCPRCREIRGESGMTIWETLSKFDNVPENPLLDEVANKGTLMTLIENGGCDKCIRYVNSIVNQGIQTEIEEINTNNDLKHGNVFAIASLVLGIVSLVGVWGPFKILFAVIGIALGAVAQKQLSEAGTPHGIATAGKIVGIYVTIVCVLNLLRCL